MVLKGDLIAQAYDKIGIDALNIGELDLSIGINYLLEKNRNPGLPFISSNIVYRSGKNNVFQPFIIKKVNGLNIAIFGLLPVFTNDVKDIKILSPEETARVMVAKLRAKADIIILLSNLGQSEDEKLAREVSGIDIIIGGRNKVLLQTPLRIEDTLILQAQAQGKYIGRLDYYPKGRTFINSLTPMDNKISKSQDIEIMLKNYKDAVVSINSNKPKPITPDITKGAYVGKDACARCHSQQASFWKLTKHADSYETLVKRNNHMDIECVRCHVTGYGTPGGFTLGVENPDLRGVQCEICHGPGGRHKGKGDIRRATDAATCRVCHNAERDPDFNYLSSLDKIRCPK